MTEDEKVMLVETEQRSKSNTYQINEIKSDIKEIKEDQKAIYQLTTSVKLIAQNIVHIQEDVNEIKQGQTDLSAKVDTQIKDIKSDVEVRVNNVKDKVNHIEKAPYDEYIKTKHEVKVKVLVGVVSTIALGAISTLIALFSNGNIKL
ncbi:protein of unknown function [Ruminococcaceae bacterium BL-6]|nr:protein of unknown function [Ruminococcaceae bacterium BL-6]